MSPYSEYNTSGGSFFAAFPLCDLQSMSSFLLPPYRLMSDRDRQGPFPPLAYRSHSVQSSHTP